MLHEKCVDSQCVGTIKVPAEKGKGQVIPISVGQQQLQQIHSRFAC